MPAKTALCCALASGFGPRTRAWTQPDRGDNVALRKGAQKNPAMQDRWGVVKSLLQAKQQKLLRGRNSFLPQANDKRLTFEVLSSAGRHTNSAAHYPGVRKIHILLDRASGAGTHERPKGARQLTSPLGLHDHMVGSSLRGFPPFNRLSSHEFLPETLFNKETHPILSRNF